MSASILVTGGTGTLGRLVVPLLVDEGHRVRVLSRRPQPPAAGVEQVVGDLASGVGVPEAVRGVETVLHLAGEQKGDAEKARRLVTAAQGAGGPHVVYVSVVGADRIPVRTGLDRSAFGYYDEKRRGEEAIESSGLPWTTLRATQFHEFVVQVVDQLAKSPLTPYFAGVDFQTVAAREVAARLVALVGEAPAGRVPDLGGPEVHSMRSMASDYLRAVHRRRVLVPLWLPGGAARAMREGAQLLDGGDTGRQTWSEFLVDLRH